MNYKSFNLGDWIGHISGVIEDETTLDGNKMRDLVEFLSTLKQEPFINKPCISSNGVCEHDKNEVLGKIRAEIEQLSTTTCTETCRISIDADVFKENVLAILDKYKAESEVEE